MGNTIYNSTPITTAGTTLIKTGQGILGGFLVQGGTTGTITIYDGVTATGKLLANFDTTVALNDYPIDEAFSIGCTVVTSANTKVLIRWK